MAKQLYEVEVKYYVMAEDEIEAQRVRLDLDTCSVFAVEATSVDADWWNAIPYNGDDNKTCGQILKEKNT